MLLSPHHLWGKIVFLQIKVLNNNLGQEHFGELVNAF